MQYIVGDVSVQRVDRYRFESQFGGDRIDRIFAELPLEEYLPDSGIAAGFDQVAEVRRRRLFPFVFEWNLRQSVIVRQVGQRRVEDHKGGLPSGESLLQCAIQ